jgi:hypothetical protein
MRQQAQACTQKQARAAHVHAQAHALPSAQGNKRIKKTYVQDIKAHVHT